MGAFKFRGAYNFLGLAFAAHERARGVVAFSSGNHAQGVALAARLLGVPATIVMPTDAPAVKLAATRGYGAEVVLYERETLEPRRDRARASRPNAARRSCRRSTIPRIVAGAGTAALELLEDAGPLDAIVVPVGGGGLMGGPRSRRTASIRRSRSTASSPKAGDDFAQSLARGERVTIPVPQDDRRRPADDFARRADVSDRARARARAS